MRPALVSAFAIFGTAGFAAADTAYFQPSTYAPKLGQTITAEASFNDDCCDPKYPVRSSAYAVILPDGSSIAPERLEYFATSSVLEHTLEMEGTTRLSTGERLGRKGEYVRLDGVYYLINSDDAEPIDIPEGTPILSSQTATVSDTYVTIGAPSWDSVGVQLGRLALEPYQHPSTLTQDSTFDLKVTFDGQPLAQQALVLTREGQGTRLGDEGLTVFTDDEGDVSLPLIKIGTHLIMTRFQAPAPMGAETDIRSYTTSLTFNVTQAPQ